MRAVSAVSVAASSWSAMARMCGGTSGKMSPTIQGLADFLDAAFGDRGVVDVVAALPAGPDTVLIAELALADCEQFVSPVSHFLGSFLARVA
jgi:hypothetical protein